MFDALHQKEMTGTDAGSALDVPYLTNYRKLPLNYKPMAQVASRVRPHAQPPGAEWPENPGAANPRDNAKRSGSSPIMPHAPDAAKPGELGLSRITRCSRADV